MKLSKKDTPRYLAIVLSIIAVAFVLSLDISLQFQNLITDNFFIEQEQSTKITIVQIGERSLKQIGSWPWDREVFAKVVENLDGSNARVIAFDVIFAEDRAGTGAFARSILEADAAVVLAGKLEDSGIYVSPRQELLENASTGFANFNPDFDGKVRNGFINLQTDESCMDSFAFISAKRYLNSKAEPDCNASEYQLGFNKFTTNNNSIKINYSGPAGHYQRLDIYDVYTGNFDRALVEDRLILVGSTVIDLKSNLQDNLINPFDGETMPGVEMHANLANTILEGNFIYPINPVIEILIYLVVCVSVFIIFSKLQLLPGLLLLGVLEITYLFLVAILFGYGYIINSLAIPIILVLLWLIENFWRYYLKRKENEELRKAFGQYVNDHLLNEILKNPKALKLGGQLRNMSVLFSDIRGFTTTSEKMSAEQLVQFLNLYLTKMTNIILKNDGVVDKFIGDAVMALWGAPLETEQHAYLACKTALAMTNALDDFNRDNKGEFEKIEIGIGINSGEMIAGNIGSSQRFDYSVLGDNVNLASRLEGLTKYYGVKILIGQNTFDQLKQIQKSEEFSIRLLDQVTVKGKDNAVKLYELLSEGKPDLVREYEAAFELYQKGDFKQAKINFEKLYAEYADPASDLLSSRCAELLAENNSSWNGVWNWSTK